MPTCQEQLICVRWLHIMTMNLWTQGIHKLWPIYPPVPILSRKTSWVWYQDKRYTQMEVYPIKCDHKPWGLGWFWGTYPQHPKTISSFLKSQELYSRPTLDTPHFPKASWYVSSLYHIISHCTCSKRLESPSVPIQGWRFLKSSDLLIWSKTQSTQWSAHIVEVL